MRVSFGFVNCNRLHYLQSCVESTLLCTSDYDNKEFIIVDNASVESGTDEYLRQKSDQGIKVIKQQHRDPNNEFAVGLNTITKLSTGEFICPIQADTQFVVKGGWLKKYVDFYSANKDNVGCITFDAQRLVTINNRSYTKLYDGFLVEASKQPVCGAGDVMYSREILNKVGPWNTKNLSHEGGSDSETEMYKVVSRLVKETNWKPFAVSFVLPVSVGIYTDSRGTNARVRGNKRYGDYWKPKESYTYYKIDSFDNLYNKEIENLSKPLCIEHIAKPVGWSAPIDQYGSWKKNPIRPESAQLSDYTVLYEEAVTANTKNEEEYLKDWLEV